MREADAQSALAGFADPVASWFAQVFDEPTPAQCGAWPAIASGNHTLLLAPTGSGKTLAAFLVAINRLMFTPPEARARTRILYISPLKALGVDVERNLRAPIAGVRAVASQTGVDVHVPSIGIRTGDTPSGERQRLIRQPPDILITTPESLYLMLTSRARDTLLDVETVIIDEIHAMVPVKRGAHLFLSLERLHALHADDDRERAAVQRIGLSATQRPLDEVARLLGGFSRQPDSDEWSARPVTIVDAGARKPLHLTVEMASHQDAYEAHKERPDGDDRDGAAAVIQSAWPTIHERLVELIREHRSTMIFVNSRRLAERLAQAINDVAEAPLAAAHHGSIARHTRSDIESQLKRGELPAIVATSSLELGVDMGAVDLVVQIEAPPSIASGLQRIGRAGHQVGGESKGIIFPKYRGDLLACAAVSRQILDGQVEPIRYPRNPLDVLAQQIVAIVAMQEINVDDLYTLVVQCASFAELPRASFDAVLDLLSGRYPSDEFSELRPRVTWDRITGQLTARQGAQRIAVVNAGTIPDRGLYGVYLANSDGARAVRVGELDEEMVFETQPGDVFLLGASSWQVTEITHDRVLVVPAPGQPGRMPFWRGDGPGRSYAFGVEIGLLARELAASDRKSALHKLENEHQLSAPAATSLYDYVMDQKKATGEVPSDRTIVIERFPDEIGDWRITLLTPFGARVHAPWAMVVLRALRTRIVGEVDMVWSDDGMVFRVPQTDTPPATEWFFPASDEVERIVVQELGGTALFASHFRENSGRALLLPRRYPGKRTPLWLQRRRSADLLSVAARFDQFPMVLETYREVLGEVFDLRSLQTVLKDVEARRIRINALDRTSPSPFAAAMLFNYVGNFIYNGDAPLAERRAQALSLDYSQLRELLGTAELRELLDTDVVATTELELQWLDGVRVIRDADSLHDALRRLGDLSEDELRARLPVNHSKTDERDYASWRQQLLDAGRIIPIQLKGDVRYIAVEDIARYRDALGIKPPTGIAAVFLQPVDDALGDLLGRFARTHGPFNSERAAGHFGLGVEPVNATLKRLVARDRLVEGEFLPSGRGREWCDVGVLRKIKRRCLAHLREEIEPVDALTYCRFLLDWHGINQPRRGLDGLLDVIEQLQGTPLPAGALETQMLPARISDYSTSDLDQLCAAGEVVWCGVDSIGDRDGRIALYLTDSYATLAPSVIAAEGELVDAVRELLSQRGAVFFEELCKATQRFPADVLAALWQLVWAGEVSNDTLAPVRALYRPKQRGRRPARHAPGRFRTRRSQGPPGSEGRWSLLTSVQMKQGPTPSSTQQQTARVTQLLERYGVVSREITRVESISGGFAGLYPILRAMEDAGRARRGYFIAGQGAAQFALAGADDRMRAQREPERAIVSHILAATDPANPYGASIAWPAGLTGKARAQRASGARVLIDDGQLLGWLNPNGEALLCWPADDEPMRSQNIMRIAQMLQAESSPRAPIMLSRINDAPAARSLMTAALIEHGFVESSKGLLNRGLHQR